MITKRGILLFLLAVPLLAAGTWLPEMRPLAAVYLLVAAGLCGADWWRAGDGSRFVATRTHDAKLSLAGDNPIRLTIRNRTAWGQTTLWVRDEPPLGFELPEGEPQFTAVVGSGETWTTSYHVRPLRRGDFTFGHLNVRWLGPLGLFARQTALELPATVKVYPNLLEVRRYDLLLRQNRLTELGLRQARLAGQGSEFERLREYRPDDEYRRINWKGTARRQRPIVAEYQTERSQTITAVVDVGRLMQSPVADVAKLDYVINAVLLLAYVATGMGDKIGLTTFADEITTTISPHQGRGQFYKMLELLYRIEPQPVEPDYGRVLRHIAHKQRKRALILIFTDLSGGLGMQTLVDHVQLLARRSLPLVVTISDPDIKRVAAHTPENSAQMYQQVAAQQLLDERQIMLDNLRRYGVLSLDVPANELSMAVINRYLELKQKLRL